MKKKLSNVRIATLDLTLFAALSLAAWAAKKMPTRESIVEAETKSGYAEARHGFDFSQAPQPAEIVMPVPHVIPVD